MNLTERDESLLDALTSRVRMFSLNQLASSYWTDASTARRRLSKLAEAGLVTSLRHTTRLPENLVQPVLAWRPRNPAPEFGRVAWRLQSRWSQSPQSTTLYLATRQAGNLFGVRRTGRIPQPLQVEHDLGLSAVYLHYLDADSEAAARWVGEDAPTYPSTPGKTPDAFILSQDGKQPQLAIEFGGAYPPERVRAFHEHCEAEQLAYEIW